MGDVMTAAVEGGDVGEILAAAGAEANAILGSQ
jgi:hypothetical protein